MKSTKKKKSGFSFKGKVKKDVQNTKAKSKSYGYLNLPSGVGVFKPEEGRMTFNIIPYIVSNPKHPDKDEKNGIAMPGEPWYKLPIKIHRNIGASKTQVVCPTSFGKKCPICEYRAKLFKEGASQKETDALKTFDRILYNVIPVGHKKMEEKNPYLGYEFFIVSKEIG